MGIKVHLQEFGAILLKSSAKVGTYDCSLVCEGSEVLDTIDGALSRVNGVRADLSATQNRFQSTIRNLSNISENVSAARSQIKDTDFATTTAELTRQQIIQQASFIDQQFRAHTCNNCGGNWILVEDYVSWKERNPQYCFTDATVTEDVADSQHALLCPVSGVIMRKLRITKDSSHRLDYSAPVGGVWLDKGEWELLKSAGLAGSLNGILTEQWQNKIREQKAEETFTQLYISKFGEDDYQKIKTLREWLQQHPKKADLRSYLLADDPYSAKK